MGIRNWLQEQQVHTPQVWMFSSSFCHRCATDIYFCAAVTTSASRLEKKTTLLYLLGFFFFHPASEANLPLCQASSKQNKKSALSHAAQVEAACISLSSKNNNWMGRQQRECKHAVSAVSRLLVRSKVELQTCLTAKCSDAGVTGRPSAHRAASAMNSFFHLHLESLTHVGSSLKLSEAPPATPSGNKDKKLLEV